MRRFIILLLLVMNAPAIAAPAHRQPTPAALPASTDPGITTSTDPKYKARIKKTEREQAEKKKVFDIKTNKTMGGICRGC